jgi:hypothetical protein
MKEMIFSCGKTVSKFFSARPPYEADKSFSPEFSIEHAASTTKRTFIRLQKAYHSGQWLLSDLGHRQAETLRRQIA